LTYVLAATTQQKVGLAIAIVILLAWIVYIVTTTRRTAEPGSEIELAPNRRPYLSDDAMEGPRLDKALVWAMALMGVVAVGLPLYWLHEPSRIDGAVVGFNKRAINRGHDLYTPAPPPSDPGSRKPHFGCSTCHGEKGEGAVATYTIPGSEPPKQVQWQCPPLNTVTLRFRDEEIKNIIVYGRPNTPMPAWGLEGGGPMNDQQIDDLIAYLHSIALTPEEAKAQSASLGTNGQAIFDGHCARCHTLGFSYGEPGPPGGGAFGPSLRGGATRSQFPEIETQIEWVTETAEYGKPYGVRGVSTGRMPHFSNMLTPEQIKAVVDYERTL
jgi:mono/diheme cytochrome c family protein